MNRVVVVVRVVAPGFCAGVVFSYDGVVACAPILRKHVRLCTGPRDFARYCRRKGWAVEWWTENTKPRSDPFRSGLA